MSDHEGSEPVRRREFLDFMIGGSLLVTAIGVVSSVIRYVRPPKEREGGETGPVEVASVAEIPPGTGKVLPHEHTSVIVIHEGDQFVALSAVCPHANCVVGFNPDTKQVECPCHGAVFDMQGNVLAGPPPRPLTRYRVEVQGDKIMVGA